MFLCLWSVAEGNAQNAPHTLRPDGGDLPAGPLYNEADLRAIRDMMEFEALFLLPAFTFTRSGVTFYLLQPYPQKISAGHDYDKLHRMFVALCMAGEIMLVTRREVPFPDYDRHLPILVHGTFLVFRSDWKKSYARLFERTTLAKVIGAEN